MSKYHHKYINNLLGPSIMEDVEPNVQRHVTGWVRVPQARAEMKYIWSYRLVQHLLWNWLICLDWINGWDIGDWLCSAQWCHFSGYCTYCPGTRNCFISSSQNCQEIWWRWYRTWTKFILLWAVYSLFFTPMEFWFFRGLPKDLVFLDIASQIVFLIDIVIQFFLTYRDTHAYRMVCKCTSIALRYLKSSFVIDLIYCLSWDIIYKACGRKEKVRYLLWIRLIRVRKVTDFF